MVDIVKGGGRAPPPTPGWADFSLRMECTPESGHCHSVCTLWVEPPDFLSYELTGLLAMRFLDCVLWVIDSLTLLATSSPNLRMMSNIIKMSHDLIHHPSSRLSCCGRGKRCGQTVIKRWAFISFRQRIIYVSEHVFCLKLSRIFR